MPSSLVNGQKLGEKLRYYEASVKVVLGEGPYPGFRYTLLVPMVRWLHFLYLKPLVCIPFSAGAISDVSTKNLVFTYFGESVPLQFLKCLYN